MARIIGETYKVIVDIPVGSSHPDYPDITFEVNYGYVDGVLAADGEAQYAYILGPKDAIEEFEGKLVAIIHRINDVENKWVIAKESYTKEEIFKQIEFMEKYFKVEVLM
jgi:inorganic pyrophosphatase